MQKIHMSSERFGEIEVVTDGDKLISVNGMSAEALEKGGANIPDTPQAKSSESTLPTNPTDAAFASLI